MANAFFVRCDCRNRRFTGDKSRFLQEADGGKGIANAADELCGIAFTKPQFETFTNRLCELNNHSHLWSNCGGQPVEMYDGLDNAELDAAAIMKTMQLDPDGYYRNPVLSRITPKKNEDGQD